MITRFRLPDLGEGLTESEIVAWRVAEGDVVGLDQVLADVETAKASVELPSPCAGIVERLHVPEGAMVPVGTVLVSFRVDDASSTGYEEAVEHRADAGTAEASPPNLVGYGAGAEGTGTPVRRPRRFSSSGPAPVVADHRPPAGVAAETQGVERVPVRGVRRAVAAAMVASAAVPHVTLFTTVDVTPTVDLLAAHRDPEGRSPTFLAAVARGLCLAVRTHPEVNARWDGLAEEIVLSRAVHLGVAVATPRGLLVPVLRDADGEDLAGLARRIRDVAATARSGRAIPADLAGGTLTVSNVGVFGVDAGTPLLHDGQAAILAVGAVARRPWEWRGEVALRSIVTLSLTIDHRVLDGEQGGLFLADLGRVLADPVTDHTRGAPS